MTESTMSKVLAHLSSVGLPENRGEISLDWKQGALAEVPNARLSEHFFCPCECLMNFSEYGMEIQHHDGVLGAVQGPAGIVFGQALANQSHGYNNMQALVSPNLAPPIRTMIVTKVKTDSLTRVVQLWGAAQEGIGRAVTDAWENKWFPSGYDRTHVLVCGVFIHPFAGLAKQGEDGKVDPKKFLDGDDMENSMHALYVLNYLTTIGLLADALTGGLTSDERVARAKDTKHPFRGFTNKTA